MGDIVTQACRGISQGLLYKIDGEKAYVLKRHGTVEVTDVGDLNVVGRRPEIRIGDLVTRGASIDTIAATTIHMETSIYY